MDDLVVSLNVLVKQNVPVANKKLSVANIIITLRY